MVAPRMEIIWSPRARLKLEEIGDYIAKDAPDRASAFEDKLIDSVSRLKDFPKSGSIVPENESFRQVILQGYRIIYRIRGTSVDIVTIISPGQNSLPTDSE